MLKKEFALELDIDKFIANHSVSCVVIGFENEELKVLVLKWKGANLWTIPVGFVGKNTSLDDAAKNVLQDRTGIKLPFLEQFYTFGSLNRRKLSDKKFTLETFNVLSTEFVKWVDKRFIGTGYLSLVDIKKCSIEQDKLSDSCEWITIDKLPNLLFDHTEMVQKALEKIRMQINYLPIGLNLLPKKFTMKTLQSLYEAILQKELDRGNFQKKMLKLNVLIRLEKQLNGGAHKAPYLYKFDKIKYNQLLQSGFSSVF